MLKSLLHNHINNKSTLIAVTVIAVIALASCLLLQRRHNHVTTHVTPSILTLYPENPDTIKMGNLRDIYHQELSEIDYYMLSHSLLDEGFDIVTRRREHITNKIDSLTRLMDATGRYELLLPFFVLNQSKYIYHKEYHQADTLCMTNNGIAMIDYPDHSYYEGQYIDTLYEDSSRRLVRHGFGVAFDAKRIRAGVWDNDIYHGEQPLYTSNHIYGIDISRYQHEQPGKTKATRKWKTVRKRVKIKGRWRYVTRRERVTKTISYPIDWSRLRITSLGTRSKKKIEGVVDYPISFVYIKSTEGVSILNKYYLGDYKQSRLHGYKTGTYHFFSIKSSASSQAMFFIKNSRYNTGDLPPVLDVEPTPKQVAQMGGARIMLSRVRQWMELVERYLGVRPLLYVSQNFVNRYLNDKYDDGTFIKDNYQIWIARYGEYKPDVHLIYWQLCPDGRVAGIHFPVDINIFNGYADTFKEFAK